MTVNEVDMIVNTEIEGSLKSFKKIIPTVKQSMKQIQEVFEKIDTKSITNKLSQIFKFMNKKVINLVKSIKNNEASIKINNKDAEEQINQIQKQIDSLQEKIDARQIEDIIEILSNLWNYNRQWRKYYTKFSRYYK